MPVVREADSSVLSSGKRATSVLDIDVFLQDGIRLQAGSDLRLRTETRCVKMQKSFETAEKLAVGYFRPRSVWTVCRLLHTIRTMTIHINSRTGEIATESHSFGPNSQESDFIASQLGRTATKVRSDGTRTYYE